MYYSVIGLLALLTLLMENQDILLNREHAFDKPAWKVYRKFLFAVMVYYITDILWGFIGSFRLPHLLFADTTVYFVAMAVGVLCWAEYTVAYLDERNEFGKVLLFNGRLVAGLITLLAVISQKGDYEQIDELVQMIEEHNKEALKAGGIVIACGMSKQKRFESGKERLNDPDHGRIPIIWRQEEDQQA